ncbi:hypothetical protein GCM10027612_87290 [Microbispora bryophytorum subsp. camponoti]|nr:hypothetical protein [Microbispora camponoti]
MMLEQLQTRLGQRVLEAGAGTGYNAALMAAIVGDTGHITTMDVDQELVDGVRHPLTAPRYSSRAPSRASTEIGLRGAAAAA